MIVIQTIAVAFAMYSAIPMPRFEWNRFNMKYVMVAFPLVGTVTGLLIVLAQWCCRAAPLPVSLTAAVSTVVPVIVTGGIHLDGFADTTDALASRKEKKEMLSIMQDPHIGTFAVIGLCMVFLLTFTLWSSAEDLHWILLPAGMTLARILSGLSVCSFPVGKNSGLVHLFAEAADRKRVRTILFIADICLCLFLFTFGTQGTAVVIVAHLVWLYSYRKTKRAFGGITGDTCGWFLVLAELAMLASVVLIPYVEKVLSLPLPKGMW